MLKRNYAYIDGSFNPKTNIYGWGGFLIDQVGKRWIIKGCGSDPNLVKMRNVAGEIMGATEAIKKALKLHMEKLTIYYDYEGISAWALGTWKAKKGGTKRYAEFVKKAMKTLRLYFKHVKSHTGIDGNELADRLAKEAVGLLVENIAA